MLTRVAQNSQHTLAVDLEVDGEPTAATGDVSIEVLRADGTVLTSGTASARIDPGRYEFTLTPAQTADLDFLEARWTATLDGAEQIITTWAEVVGAHVVSIAEMRRHEPLDDDTTYTADALTRARDLATYALERACNRGFTTHYARETIQPSGTSYLPLRGRLVRSASSVTVGATALDADGLAAVFADRAGYLYRSSGWAYGSNVTVEYLHGEQVAHPEVARAICLIAAEILFEDALDGDGSAIPDRATSISSEAGTFSLVTPGVGSAAFSLPEVNAVVEQWRIP